MNKLHEMLKIANIHADKINMARDELAVIFPLDQGKVLSLTKQNLLFIELLISRFAKLQDLLGKKIINEFLILAGEFIDDLTMLDKINKLESLGIIESTQIWKEMRSARNHISHEYPDHPELTAKYINQIFDFSPKLINILNKIKTKPVN